MKVALSEIPEAGLTLSEKLDPVQMNLLIPELTFRGPIQVSAFFQKERDTVMVEVMAQAKQECICGRCLETYPKDFVGHFSFRFPRKDRTFLDVTDDIRQEILLSYPVRFVCSEECLGLCPSCGKNLNFGPCSCTR